MRSTSLKGGGAVGNLAPQQVPSNPFSNVAWCNVFMHPHQALCAASMYVCSIRLLLMICTTGTDTPLCFLVFKVALDTCLYVLRERLAADRAYKVVILFIMLL